MKVLWLQVILLVLLSGLGVWKRRQRIQAERRAEAARLQGHGFEATEINARLRERRERHAQGAASRRRPTPTHEEFTARVRTSLLQLDFFRKFQESGTVQAGHDPQADNR